MNPPFPQHSMAPLADRAPLRVLFAVTSMPVGGAETLLVNLVRRLDRNRFAPQLCCLKEPGPLGTQLAREIPAHTRLLTHKFDIRVLYRLTSLVRRERIDAVITVGAGDKMFWGRLAAWLAGSPVIVSALHSTGWPDGIGRLNRILTPLTDAFVGVAERHGRYLIEKERLPAGRVHVIPNGVDERRFRRLPGSRDGLRRELNAPLDAPLCGIVAALRQEKNLQLFLRSAALIRRQLPTARFVIVGDGPERQTLEQTAAATGIHDSVHFLGARDDIPRLLSALDVFSLSSHNEANPVSILEAMSVGLPVVATRVGSVPETVRHDVTGYLVEPGDAEAAAARCLELMQDPPKARQMGSAGRREVLNRWTLDAMVAGYEDLITEIYQRKCGMTKRCRRHPGTVERATPSV